MLRISAMNLMLHSITNPKGYPVKVLPEIAEYWNGITYKPEDVVDDGTIVLRSSNIQNAALDFADTVRVSRKIKSCSTKGFR